MPGTTIYMLYSLLCHHFRASTLQLCPSLTSEELSHTTCKISLSSLNSTFVGMGLSLSLREVETVLLTLQPGHIETAIRVIHF